MTTLTIFECSDIEASWFAQLAAEQEAEERDIEARMDLVDRLHGTCERCRDEDEQQLVILGDEAICRGCVEAMGLDFNAKVEESWVPVAPREGA